ncbi:MAG: T9SS type A sorting domain-containing protein, partial [Bacteroidota bacterium]
INSFGDTIASGNLYWFGQIGGTTIDYPVTLLPTAICTPNFLGYSAVFVFDDDTCTLTFPCTTSITEESENNSNITLFPNPASDNITIQSPTDFTETPAIITLYDQKGRVVKSLETTSNTINISDLPNGFYTVKYKTEREEFFEKMLKED